MSDSRASLNAAISMPIQENLKFSTAMIRFLNELVNNTRLNTGNSVNITISSGAISVGENGSYFTVDTESAASTDDLVTINNGKEGDLIFIRAANSARTVVLKDGSGNILTNGSVDLSLDNTQDLVVLHYDGTNWKADLWNIGA
jgi:hypothetical protein